MRLSNTLPSFLLGLATAFVAIHLIDQGSSETPESPESGGNAVAEDETSDERTSQPAAAAAPTAVQPASKPLRIICFGAHPDDCELRAAGVAAKWAEQGHKVKFVSLTNGDIGHWKMAGGPLAQRRNSEVQRCAKILGITAQVLDIHDGELLPTLDNRRTVTRLIRCGSFFPSSALSTTRWIQGAQYG